jgi:hypothetical protein
MSEPKSFHVIADDGVDYGPISESELRNWIRDGRVHQNNHVWQVGTADWKPISEHVTLRTTPPPRPPASSDKAWSQGSIPQDWLTAPKSVETPPLLWNPSAAARWSLLFTPAFGAFLHARNAESLGRTDEAKTNKMWFYISIIHSCVAFGVIFLPAILNVAYSVASVSILLAWNFAVAAKQIRYVKKELNGRYQRKSLLKPLFIGLGGVVVYVFLAAALASYLGILAQIQREL